LPPGHASAPSLTWFNTNKALFVTFAPLLNKLEKILREITLQTKVKIQKDESQVKKRHAVCGTRCVVQGDRRRATG
jgi:hypothetical protein